MTWEIIKHLDEVSDENLMRLMEHGYEARKYIINRWPHIVFPYVDTSCNTNIYSRFINVISHVSQKTLEQLIMTNVKHGYMPYIIHDLFNIHSVKLSKRTMLYLMRYGEPSWPETIIELLVAGEYDVSFITAALATHLEIVSQKTGFVAMLIGTKYVNDYMIEYAMNHRSAKKYSNEWKFLKKYHKRNKKPKRRTYKWHDKYRYQYG